MTHSHDYQTEAVVIKKTKLGEADRIFTFFTPGLGKIQGVAKSVRKPKSKMAGHLELLTYTTVNLQRGRGSLDTITGAQTIDSFLPLKNDLLLTSFGLYITELIDQFTSEDEDDAAAFHLLVSTLKNLCTTDNRDLLLRYFELKLLDLMGYRPELHECIICHKPLEPVVNSFSASAGGAICPFCAAKQVFAREITVNAVKVMRFIQDNDFDVVARLKINPQLAKELEVITRHYLKYLLERDVKSVYWLDTVREQLRSNQAPSSKS
jgi:DNA repair protein RecO (recombination protein O)